MNRIVRAAGLAAVVVAFAPTTAFAAPATPQTAPASAYSAYGSAAVAESDFRLDQVSSATPAAPRAALQSRLIHAPVSHDVAPRVVVAATPSAAPVAVQVSNFAAPAVAPSAFQLAVPQNAPLPAVAPTIGSPAPPKANPFAQLFHIAIAAVVGDRHEAAAPRPTLDELVAASTDVIVPDSEQDCLANAVYFEARGEPIEGQLAVADVVLNRAASGRYPATICAVVTQRAQFSFIRRGRFPAANKASEAWRKAVAIARIARDKLVDGLPSNVLWYHASYVAPSWCKRLNRNTQIGLHIFYS